VCRNCGGPTPQLLFAIRKNIHAKQNTRGDTLTDFIGAAVAVILISAIVLPIPIAIWAVIRS
jgi:hypothetical protein